MLSQYFDNSFFRQLPSSLIRGKWGRARYEIAHNEELPVSVEMISVRLREWCRVEKNVAPLGRSRDVTVIVCVVGRTGCRRRSLVTLPGSQWTWAKIS